MIAETRGTARGRCYLSRKGSFRHSGADVVIMRSDMAAKGEARHSSILVAL